MQIRRAVATAQYADPPRLTRRREPRGGGGKQKRAMQVAGHLASRAAEVATGAMVALVPTAPDLDRLAVDGGEPTDQLHLTLAYLGKAADWPAEARAAVIDAVRALAEGKPPVEANGFAISAFNPAGDEPCIVLGVGGDGLNWVHDAVAEAISSVAESAGTSLPDQHSPWVPHVSLLYSDDFNRIKDLVDRAGPIAFDAIRVAFAGDNTDVPLTGADGDRADWTPELHPRDPANGKFTEHPGGGFAHKMAQALNGQAALDATPAKLRRAPGGHHGDYAGEGIDGPPGVGTVRALSEYEGLEYQHTNTYLRGGYRGNLKPGGEPVAGTFLEGTPERIAEIDKTMAVSRLHSDVRVDRVMKEGFQVFGDAWYGDVMPMSEKDFEKQDRDFERWEAGERPDLTGLRWTDAAYQSTSADPAVAPRFGKRWPASNSATDGEPIIIHMFVPAGTGGIQLSEMGHDAEILLERGLTMLVEADHGVGTDGFRHLDIRVVTDGNP